MESDFRFAVLGGGFALYGWLPAACRLSRSPVKTLERYANSILKRKELHPYLSQIDFVEREEDLLSWCNVVICARRPSDQHRLVSDSVHNGWVGKFVLEKPLGQDPDAARHILDLIESCKCDLAIGYSLAETGWAKEMVHNVTSGRCDRISISWRFMAHHYAHQNQSWKKNVSQGGGALRFFSIHFLPIFARCGKCVVVRVSPLTTFDEDECFELGLLVNGVEISLLCNSQAPGTPSFEIRQSFRDRKASICQGVSPFISDLPSANEVNCLPAFKLNEDEDSRIIHLIPILKRVTSAFTNSISTERINLELWEQIEYHRGF